jgi:hypothetical protein
MKKFFIVLFTILIIILSLASDGLIMGQPPAPPGEHGLNGNQGQGGAAPLDGGSLLLILGAAVYGAVRWIRERKGGTGGTGGTGGVGGIG